MSKGKVFNAQEVQAIIAGNKTMFREVIKPKPDSDINPVYIKECDAWQWWSKENRRKPRYQVGQKIFVKESFNIFAGQVAYKQSLANAERYIWKPASQMKQEHSRLTLLIKEIRVERLQDISEEDCINEGFDYDWLGGKGNILIAGSITNNFAKNWNATHKKPEEKFGANPWVWSIQFEVVK